MKKRLQSFAWRLGSAIVVFGLAWISDNLNSLGLPVIVSGLIALILPEITKWWNSNMALKGKNFFGVAK